MIILQLVITALILSMAPAAFALMGGVRRKWRHSWDWDRGSPKRSPKSAAAVPHRATPSISVVRAADVPISTASARIDADAATRADRLAQVIAAVLHAAMVVAIILAFVHLPHASNVALAAASVAPQLLILAWSLRLSPRTATRMFVVYGTLDTLLISRLSDDAGRTLIWSSIFAVLVIPPVLFLFARGVEVLVDEQLHIHIAQLAVTVYFELWAFNNDKFTEARLMFASALVCSIATEHLLWFRIRARRPKIADKGLLLLRAFAGPDKRQDLLDDLRDTWQRVGTIELFAGSDVATRTMRPLLAVFVRRRRHVLRSEEDVDTQLAQLDVEIESNARYPLNAIYASAEIWKSAFLALEKNADIVLVDLRGFTMEHAGCVLELKHLRDHRHLRCIVFLIDNRTDLSALESLLGGYKITVLDYGRRSDEDRRALFDLLLNAAYE